MSAGKLKHKHATELKALEKEQVPPDERALCRQ
jgi:hypothetical protein